MKNLKEEVYEYPTKHKEGFTRTEMQTLLSKYPEANWFKFFHAFTGCTMSTIDGEMIHYTTDVHTALKCAVYDRGLRQEEWD